MRSFVVLLALAAMMLLPGRANAGEHAVYLKLNPIAFAVHGTPMFPRPGGGAAGWFPDLFGVGYNHKMLDIAFHMTAQNAFPDTNEYSALFGRVSGGIRPLKAIDLSMVDLLLFAGGGFGGAGDYTKRDPSCVSTPDSICPEGRNGWGGGIHAGIGIDFAFPLVTVGTTGQQLIAFAGVELRGELFFSQGANLFTVYSMPFGIRLQ